MAVVPWRYEGPPRSLLLALKLRGIRAAGRPLVEEMARACRAAGLTASCVTWVPARPKDARRRGFDHAELLARGVAGALGLPPASLLGRRGVQADQAGLSRAARLANLTDAFTACGRVDGPVLLVDDLVTTGATAAACARALRATGATRIELTTACRA